MKRQLKIQIDGKSVDLNPGAMMELEEQNLYLQLNDELAGDYSMPIEVPLTDRNLPIFGHVNLLPAVNKTSTYNRVVVGDDLEQMTGILRKEQLIGNLNFSGTDKLSLYFLKGWSHFYKDVEKKTLYHLDFGADRVFDYASLVSHLNQVMTTGSIDQFDYAVYTIFNSGFSSTDDADRVVNYAYGNLTSRQPEIIPVRGVSVFLYLNYVIKRIFETFGWSVEGYIFTDPGFKKATVLQSGKVSGFAPGNNNISINLRDHIPAVEISKFLIALKNRFGWAYDFDVVSKKCRILKIGDVFNGSSRIDVTKYVQSAFSLKLSTARKIYALTAANNSSSPNTTQWNIKGALTIKSSLPAASVITAGHVYFIDSENRYYICSLITGSTTLYEWDLLTENDFSYVPMSKTDEVSTICLIPTMKIIPYGDRNLNDVGDMLVPEIVLADDNADMDFFYVCFAHGLAPTLQKGSFPAYQYGYGSPHHYTFAGARVGEWAMTYRFPVPSGKDEGLYALNWQEFLDRLNQEETIEVTARLPHRIAIQLKWEDSLLLNNVEYIISAKSRTIPYSDSIKLTLARI